LKQLHPSMPDAASAEADTSFQVGNQLTFAVSCVVSLAKKQKTQNQICQPMTA